jgi:hypothetical protein
MNLDYHATKPKDLSKINSKHFGELIWWSFNLNVTLEKLLTIIDQVGDSTDQIKKYIDNHH